MEIKIGQIWQEVDPRFTRYVLVVDADEENWYVRGCTIDGEFTPRSRALRAMEERFNGKRGGYKYIGDKNDPQKR